MTDKEIIRAEIERLKQYAESSKMEWIDDGYNQNAFAETCRIASFDKLLSFIDSLPEEPTPKGYDEAYLNECIAKANKTWKGVDVDKFMDEVRGRESDDLEEAVDAEIVRDIHNLLHVKSDVLPISAKHKFGDKVKIKIIKDDDK